ncbi:hypothetical protein K6119_15640 [Paracrocinitomix mangrovi]|uniref:hypothetical protein n=1 Tax=Paracrocinitomix mangrovi TaxID=2862509 RepID=UPI001C8F1940|nr:hypothetical protein [Paracrocinitomix mangrovi]UKN01162.1 hypothetical protein K6119_15640 [Paracrocinitomix mangrovi]
MKNLLAFVAFIAINITPVKAQDISGTYYVGEPNYDATLDHPWKRTYESVDIKYNSGNQTISLVYDKDQRAMSGSPTEYTLQAVKDGKIVFFKMGNIGHRSLANMTLLQIEPGIFVVDPATTVNTTCGDLKRPTKSNAPSKGGKVYPVEPLVREFILGKDKERIKYLCEHPVEYHDLVAKAVVLRCNLSSDAVAADKPKPAEGLTDSSLKTEVNTLIKNWAVAKKWPQSVSSSYISSKEWTDMMSNGRVIGREIHCVVIMSQNGVCQWKEFLVRQDYVKGSYGKSYVYGELPGAYKTDCK